MKYSGEGSIQSKAKSALIELRQVSKSFDETVVFEDFSLQIPEGDSLVLVGPSGSGKSLFLKFCAGLMNPDDGVVLYRGKEILTLSKTEEVEFLSQVGMLFQQNALFRFYDGFSESGFCPQGNAFGNVGRAAQEGDFLVS